MVRRKEKKSNNNTSIRDIGGIAAFIQGNWITKLSALIFGLGNFVHKQIIRGLLMLLIEIAYIYYMITAGFNSIADFMTLGTAFRQRFLMNQSRFMNMYQGIIPCYVCSMVL